MKTIGVDVGGTFTDLVFADMASNRTAIHKVMTTPADPSIGVLRGMLELCATVGVATKDIDHILHGTTTATNAVLEHDGAIAGLITNEGYRDILHIGRHQRPQHYSIMQEIPWQDRPLIRRRMRKTVRGRIVPPRGAILEPLDEAAVRQAARELRDEGAESIAICFLFAYLDPSHENRARDIVREEFPDCFVTTSSSVAPQFREFERFTSTAMNAFIGPRVRVYVNRLEENLARNGFRADLHVMGSNGGVATAAMVSERPVLTLLSGPAAGILGGAWAGGLSGRHDLITFDVGGTSADIGIVKDSQFAEAAARDTSIAGYPILTPMLDIYTIGAGGGSIAYVDDGGAFRVGPRSAGAQPGPAAYGLGGDKPTVTDANVVLGRLDGSNFLGGAMDLDTAASHRVVGSLASSLGLSLHETAAGIIRIVNANMANLVRSRTVQKGVDPRGMSLVAFGGGGPLQAVEVAAELGIAEVIVPPSPGATSAMGLMTTDLKYDTVTTCFAISGSVDIASLQRDFELMEAALALQLTADGVPLEQRRFHRGADLRYVGQGYELRVAINGGVLDEQALASAYEQFAAKHRAEYGHDHPADPIEIVNVRVTGVGLMAKLAKPAHSAGGSLESALTAVKECYFRVDGQLVPVPTPVYRRNGLPIGTAVGGPAIVVQTDTTTLIRPQDTMTADECGNLIIAVGTGN